MEVSPRTHEAGAQLVRAPGAAGLLAQHDEELAAAAAGELPVDLARRLATVANLHIHMIPYFTHKSRRVHNFEV